MKIKSASILLVIIVFLSIAVSGNASNDLIERGWALIDVESYLEAVECFDAAISMNSSDPEAWHGKGFALNGEAYVKDDARQYIEARVYYEAAIKCFEKAIELNPSYIDAYMDMADSENRLDNYNKALELIDKAFSIDPNNAEVVNVKGTILYRMGKYDESIELFRKAKTMDPYCGNAWYNICEFLKEQKKGDANAADEADIACQKAAEIYNTNV